MKMMKRKGENLRGRRLCYMTLELLNCWTLWINASLLTFLSCYIRSLLCLQVEIMSNIVFLLNLWLLFVLCQKASVLRHFVNRTSKLGLVLFKNTHLKQHTFFILGRGEGYWFCRHVYPIGINTGGKKPTSNNKHSLWKFWKA